MSWKAGFRYEWALFLLTVIGSSIQALPEHPNWVSRGLASSLDCPREGAQVGGIAWQRSLLRSGGCSLHVRWPQDEHPFRTFSFGSNGSLMVFNGYGEKLSDSGARLYHLFPRTGKRAEVVVNPSATTITVRTAAGAELSFSEDSGKDIGFSGGLEGKLDPAIRRDNGGGLELTHWNGVLLDGGFRLREQPFYKNPDGVAVFRDPAGRVCKVKNLEVYDYSDPEEPRFRLDSDEGAHAFLSRRCPDLDIKSLNPHRPGEITTAVETRTPEDVSVAPAF